MRQRLDGSRSEIQRYSDRTMVSKLGWSNVVLIASVQLVLILVAVIALFSWIDQHSVQSLADQANKSNLILLGNLSRISPETNVTSTVDIDKFVAPIGGFVCLFDLNQNQVVQTSKNSIDLKSVDFSDDAFTFMSGGLEHRGSLSDAFGRTVNGSESPVGTDGVNIESTCVEISGKLQVANGPFLVACRYLPEHQQVLMVGQSYQSLANSVRSKITWMERISFFVT
ncbi:MAG: hypothetical protein AAF939_04690, partial [Planctomycetota bacterium]